MESFQPFALMIWPGLAIATDGPPAARVRASHRHHLMLLRDDAVLDVGGRVMRVSRGDLVFRPGNALGEGAFWRSPPPRRVDIWISRALWPEVEAALPDARPWYRLADGLVESLVEQLARVAQRKARGEERVVAGSADLLGARLLEVLPTVPPDSGQAALSAAALRRVCDHIDDQIAQPLAVLDLARLANLSESYFARSFKAATGQSPRRFIRRRRVELAQELLRSSDKALVDIALETGFGSQSCFTTTFSELVGQSPGRFRERARRSG